MSVNKAIVPIALSSRHTRSSTDTAFTKYSVPKCKTLTFKRSFIVRTIRIGNILSDELNLCMNIANDLLNVERARVSYIHNTFIMSANVFTISEESKFLQRSEKISYNTEKTTLRRLQNEIKK